ncbi:chemotaxis protein CheC [Carnobacterium iners]|uniref:Chemotaxis protein CheC n=1 Tax=Carnobacterium iners TaxID=1073423 RepID=A0A1X7MZV6_9LACT|nr:chemotaxis protein CheC [Carnobacterium iners]SEK21213.1 chemotaxis protein CheC [Carnobacterium iners]SMH30470.1 chemotaxis protein CheC [Carnobacterium iners]
MNSEYSALELDALKEVINIGGGNAATSLSNLIDKPVNMTVPIIEMLDYSEVYEQIMPEDAVVKAIMMRMFGDADGMFLFTVDQAASESIVKMMMPEGISYSELLADSALQELVNILVHSFLNAIIKLLDIQLVTSVPLLTKDMFGAIMSSVYVEQGQYEESVMIIKNEFYYAGDRLESSLYFVPQPGILEKMFELLGVGGED